MLCHLTDTKSPSLSWIYTKRCHRLDGIVYHIKIIYFLSTCFAVLLTSLGVFFRKQNIYKKTLLVIILIYKNNTWSVTLDELVQLEEVHRGLPIAQGGPQLMEHQRLWVSLYAPPLVRFVHPTPLIMYRWYISMLWPLMFSYRYSTL